MELAAYDYAGDAIYLGAPVHFTIYDNIDTDFVLQEPPKHSYYDNNPQSATYGQVITISRRDEFNVSLQDSTSTTFESTSTDTTATTIGEALEASAGLTVKKGFDIGIAKIEGSLSGDFKYTSKWSEEETTKNINSQFGSRTVSFAGATNRDDYLSGRAQIIDIWRYRVYGFAVPSDGVQRYGFYDIMVPGPAEKFAGGGQSFDWYQPLHENGNILSYPVRLGENTGPSTWAPTPTPPARSCASRWCRLPNKPSTAPRAPSRSNTEHQRPGLYQRLRKNRNHYPRREGVRQGHRQDPEL